LWESLLAPEALRMPAELAQVDELLDDPVFFAPFRPFFDPDRGRRSIPIETFLRLMWLKYRYGLGFETLCREVTDSVSWRRFCRIPLDVSVPDHSTLGVDPSTRTRQANLLAVLGLGINDRVRQAEEAAAGHGSAAPAALVALHEFLGGASMDQLRQVVGLTPSGAVRLIDKLAEASLVRRGPGPDGRSVALTLTRWGDEAARRILAGRRRACETILAGLSSGEREALTPLLERLLGQLTAVRLAEREEAKAPAGGWLCRLCDFSACRRDVGECPVANAARPTSESPGPGE
jgi:DNA-binding MarR family transcriptional regulator